MKYYVYIHKHPDTDEVVYVGKGTGGRAWDVTRARSNHKEHQEWMLSLCEDGYVPSDWVVIIDKNLDETSAFAKEKEYLHTNGTTKFNRTAGERNHQSKMTDTQAVDAYILAKSGMSHQALADVYGVCRSAISMIASGKQWRTATAYVRSQYVS